MSLINYKIWQHINWATPGRVVLPTEIIHYFLSRVNPSPSQPKEIKEERHYVY